MKEDLIELGNRLRKARDEKGLSLADVEKSIGIGTSLISKYERGLNDPGSRALVRFAKYYNVSLDWLLGFTDDPRPIILDKDLSSSSKEDVLQYIEFLKHKEGK